MGGNLLLKLNIDLRPIANKYREGKVKRTLERELKVSEIAEREANETSLLLRDCRWRMVLGRHRKGRLWTRFSVVFLVVTCQRQLGIRRNLLFTPVFAAANSECLVWSLISTEDCVR